MHYETQPVNYFQDLTQAFLTQNTSVISKNLLLEKKQIQFSNLSAIKQSYDQAQEMIHTSAIESAQQNLIHSLILAGDCENISFFLKNSPYIYDCCPLFGLTCMHFAALGISAEMIDLLQANGFDIASQDQWGRTPLHYAALNPHAEVLQCLLKKKSDLLSKDNYGISPLDFLNYRSQLSSPVYLSKDEYSYTAALLFSTVLRLIPQPFLETVPLVSTLASYLPPLAEFAFTLKNKSPTHKELCEQFAFFLLCQQFSITKLAFSTYVFSKACFQCLQHLTISSQNRVKLPKSAAVFSAIPLLQAVMLGSVALTYFPLHTIQEQMKDLQSVHDVYDSKVAQLTLKEWNHFTSYGFNFWQNCKLFFKT